MPPVKKTTAKKTASAKKPAAKSPSKAPAKRAPAKKAEELLNAKQLQKALKDLADAIYREFPSPKGLVILGIRTRGVVLADRIRGMLEKKYGTSIGSGILDITFYRDDLSRLGPNPKVQGSDLPFDIHDANVILVDDVLYTGRTVRAALDEISDFGRPALIRLAILVDRGLREYPVQPDYCAVNAKTDPRQVVKVMLDETDDKDSVVLDWLPAELD